nr:MAG TPA: hypothetical protein [Bacteriophage sp.]
MWLIKPFLFKKYLGGLIGALLGSCHTPTPSSVLF